MDQNTYIFTQPQGSLENIMQYYALSLSSEISDFMKSRMTDMGRGVFTLSHIPARHFLDSFRHPGYTVDDKYDYVSLAVLRGEIPFEEIQNMTEQCNAVLVTVFDGKLSVNGGTLKANDIAVIKSGDSIRPSANALWGLLPYGSAVVATI